MKFVGADIRDKIKKLGRLWKSSGSRLGSLINILNSWGDLISGWAKDDSMPLIKRKGSCRG